MRASDRPPPILRHLVDFYEPGVHFFMLQNYQKYQAFQEALRPIARDRVVMDVGTGSGILALLALSQGARRVVAIDRPETAEITKAVLADWPQIGEKVHLIASDFLSLSQEQVAGVDVVVSETLGYLGFEEDIALLLSSALDLGMPGRPELVPQSIELELRPIASPSTELPSEPHLTLCPPRLIHGILDSQPEPFPLGHHPPNPIRLSWVIKVEEESTVVGTVASFRARLRDRVHISNRRSTSWPQLVFPFPESLRVARNERLALELCLLRGTGSFMATIRIRAESGTETEISWSPSPATHRFPLPSCSIPDLVRKVRELLKILGAADRLTA